MSPAMVRKQIRIKASAEALWPYIGTEAGLRQWWGSDIALEPKVGGYCEERSHAQGVFYRLCGQVTVYDPPHHLALVLRNPDGAASWPTLTTLRITLEPEGSETLVTVTHQAFGAAPAAMGLAAPFDISIDDSDPTVTSNYLARRHPRASERAAQETPLPGLSSPRLYPLLAEHLPEVIYPLQPLNTQRDLRLLSWPWSHRLFSELQGGCVPHAAVLESSGNRAPLILWFNDQ